MSLFFSTCALCEYINWIESVYCVLHVDWDNDRHAIVLYIHTYARTQSSLNMDLIVLLD